MCVCCSYIKLIVCGFEHVCTSLSVEEKACEVATVLELSPGDLISCLLIPKQPYTEEDMLCLTSSLIVKKI